ncbi:hypothetical protein GCM10027053_00120 [Intrasporangium mesophilum]
MPVSGASEDTFAAHHPPAHSHEESQSWTWLHQTEQLYSLLHVGVGREAVAASRLQEDSNVGRMNLVERRFDAFMRTPLSVRKAMGVIVAATLVSVVVGGVLAAQLSGVTARLDRVQQALQPDEGGGPRVG